jgi:hypothetical protein
MNTLELPRKRIIDMRFGIWNVRNPYRSGKLKTVASELAKYNLELVRRSKRSRRL